MQSMTMAMLYIGLTTFLYSVTNSVVSEKVGNLIGYMRCFNMQVCNIFIIFYHFVYKAFLYSLPIFLKFICWVYFAT